MNKSVFVPPRAAVRWDQLTDGGRICCSIGSTFLKDARMRFLERDGDMYGAWFICHNNVRWSGCRPIDGDKLGYVYSYVICKKVSPSAAEASFAEACYRESVGEIFPETPVCSFGKRKE